jgi:hypothetical protein
MADVGKTGTVLRAEANQESAPGIRQRPDNLERPCCRGRETRVVPLRSTGTSGCEHRVAAHRLVAASVAIRPARGRSRSVALIGNPPTERIGAFVARSAQVNVDGRLAQATTGDNVVARTGAGEPDPRRVVDVRLVRLPRITCVTGKKSSPLEGSGELCSMVVVIDDLAVGDHPRRPPDADDQGSCPPPSSTTSMSTRSIRKR